MVGRDPGETHRVSTPLELLFDLTFATSFNLAAAQFAHALAEGQFGASLAAFALASGAICWAWINFTWFASAYDTDDWIFRVVTMVQMIGVLVLAIGLPRLFVSASHGDQFDTSIMVLGYVIMRVALLFDWIRAANQDRLRRRACLTYIVTIALAQIGWVVLLALDLPAGGALAIGSVLALIEFAGPVVAERRFGGTPWHAHHLAERYGLFATIALGEGVVGTVAALSAVAGTQGWTVDTVLVGIAGTGLTFGMWWIYELIPSAPIIGHHRGRAFVWSLFQIVAVTAIVATGAGLHVSGSFLEHQTHIGALPTLLTVAIPFGVFLVALEVVHYYLTRQLDAFDIRLFVAAVLIAGGAVLAGLLGIGIAKCLLILVLAPAVIIVAYESRGYRRLLRVVVTTEIVDG